MEPSVEYYDLFATNKLNGMTISDTNLRNVAQTSTSTHITESLMNFSPDVNTKLQMTDDISSRNLKSTRDAMKTDQRMDYSSKVSNPHGHGYIPSLNEVRNNDANEILNQESVIFSLGAITGVSLIVLGLLATSSSYAENA